MKNEGISELLIEKIRQFEPTQIIEEVGSVNYVGDGIARVYGLDHAMQGEMVKFSNGAIGMIQNLEAHEVGIIIFGKYEDIHEGDLVRRLGYTMQVPVGEGLLGRVVNPLGEPIDGLGPIHSNKKRPVEAEAPVIMDRQSVTQPLQTGIKAIDALVPIGRGQRELIIGDRKTGKTTLAIDAIINQKNTDVLCVYVAIGQKASTVKNVVATLEENDALDYTIVVSASASESAPLLYLAPYAATAMAEEFMYNGRHVLIIYDDLSKQANAYREISLLLKRPPGREAYPGDVFYLHSRLLERSAKLNDELGGGSITALPIVETQAGDISAYIPTNVISITDGQIFLETDMFRAGIRPAINAGLSVSRVGGSAQVAAMKKVSGTLRIDLASYRELEAFSQFGSDLDDQTKKRLARGRATQELLIQPAHKTFRVAEQVVVLYALTKGYFDDIVEDKIREYQSLLVGFFRDQRPGILESIKQSGQLEDFEKLDQALITFEEQYKALHIKIGNE